MKYTLLLMPFLFFCSSPSWAQQSGIYLTGYTFSAKNKVVGKVKTSGTETLKKASLAGPDAGLFTLSKGNLLSIKPAALKQSGKTLHISVLATTAGGREQHDFTLLKDEFIHNSVIAHRGAWKNTGATENSIASLNHAAEIGCEGSEFDVHMSADSVLFIHHDPLIQGLKIEETTSDKLRALKLDNGEVFPTLEEYLVAGMKQQKMKLILEIKASVISKERGIALADKVLAQVKALHAEAWVDYISFDYDICLEVMRLAPYAKVAYLNGDKSPAELAAAHFYGLDYHLSVYKNHPDWIKEAKNNKLTINVWTVNTATDQDFFIAQKADFITTNEPEMLLKKMGK